MKPTNRKLGELGEQIAVDLLQSQGYKIIERNFYTKQGEIDIVAEEKDILCFVEVKYYQTNSLRNILGAVDQAKQKKIITTAHKYLFVRRIENRYTRFDVVLIEHNARQEVSKVDLIRDAFRG